MARFIGIDWDHDTLFLIAGNSNRRTARIERALSWKEPHTLDAAAAEEAGRRLRQHLKDAQITPAPVLACLGRERVIFKELRYPAVDAKEEAALVQFQAGKELTEPANRVVIDYTNSRFAGNGKERVAILSIVRRQWLQAVQALCKGAGLNLLCVTPRSYGIARCLRQARASALGAPPPAAGATVAILTVSDAWAEFTIVRDGEVRLARPLTVNDNILEDVRRNLALYANQAQGASARNSVQALYFSGGSKHAAIQERLRDVLAIPVHNLDPFADEEQVQVGEDRGSYAGLVGLARLWAEQQAPINFVSPKEPKVQTGEKRRLALLVTMLVIVLLCGSAVIGHAALKSKQAEIEEANKQLKNLEANIQALKPDEQKLDQLLKWDKTALSWPDELLELTQCFPQEKDFYVTSLTVNTLNSAVDNKKGKNKTPGFYTMQIRLKGVCPASRTDLIQKFVDNINNIETFEAPPATKRAGATRPDEPPYYEFDVTIYAAKKGEEEASKK